MDASFWHRKWEENKIGFHESEANPILVNHFKALCLSKGSRVFVPLCGKTLDISWLLSNGYRVAGAELSEIAVAQLFNELGVEPEISSTGKLKHYSAKDIDIFVGDIFDLSEALLGPIDAIYDRAALVALSEELRQRYAVRLTEITGKAPQLLVSYVYDQTLMTGPPFSLSDEEVNQHYKDQYDLTLLESINVQGGLKLNGTVKENVWLLHKRQKT